MLGPYQEDVKCLSRDLIEYGGRKQADTRSHVRTLRRLEAVFFWGGIKWSLTTICNTTEDVVKFRSLELHPAIYPAIKGNHESPHSD